MRQQLVISLLAKDFADEAGDNNDARYGADEPSLLDDFAEWGREGESRRKVDELMEILKKAWLLGAPENKFSVPSISI